MKDWMVQIFNLTHVNICSELLLCVQHRFNLTAVFPLWSLTGRDWSIRAQRRGRPGGAKGSCWTPRWGWSYWTDWWEGMNCFITARLHKSNYFLLFRPSFNTFMQSCVRIIFHLYLGSETSIYLNFSKYLRSFLCFIDVNFSIKPDI